MSGGSVRNVGIIGEHKLSVEQGLDPDVLSVIPTRRIEEYNNKSCLQSQMGAKVKWGSLLGLAHLFV